MSTDNASLTTQPLFRPSSRSFDTGPVEEQSAITRFTDTINGLYNVRTIHTDPNLASFRHDLRQTLRANPSDDPTVSEDLIRALELSGIAETFAAYFEGTEHHRCAKSAADQAAQVWLNVWHHYRPPSYVKVDDLIGPTSLGSENGDHGCRAYLRAHSLDSQPPYPRHMYPRRHLYFLPYPQDADIDDDISSTTTGSCLCPVTAYLQCILLTTPLPQWSDWVTPATPNPNASPLGITKEWLDAKVGKQTADININIIVVLICLGCFIHESMVSAAEQAAEALLETKRQAEKKGSWLDGRHIFDLASGLWTTPMPTHDRYGLVPEPVGSEEPTGSVAVKLAVHKLCMSGDQYAQLLVERDVPQERVKDSVEDIRSWVEYIVARAESPVPDTIVQLIPELAKD